MPGDIKGINIEVDIKCNEKKVYRQLLRGQKLTQKKRICGFQIFPTKTLENNKFFEWVFGVKIFKIKRSTNYEEVEDRIEVDDVDFEGLYKQIVEFH